MKRNALLVVAAVALLAALIILWWALAPAEVPGRGKPAEIIHPETGQRIATTWDKVFSSNPPPRQDPFSGGGWMANIPGTNLWGYVVNSGARHPSETRPAQSTSAP